MSVLGPSIMYASTPLALGVSIYAFARTLDRPFAIAALTLSSLEALFLTTVIMLANVLG